MTLANYPNSLINLDKQIDRSPNTFITMLAQNLVQSAQLFDLKRSQNLGVDARCEYVTRRTDKPVSYTSNSVLGAPWADDQTSPLEVGEKWNEGRRATNTNIRYTFNEHGLPIILIWTQV